MMCGFISEHRARFGVVPICRVLSEHGWRIAPRTFYAWQSRRLGGPPNSPVGFRKVTLTSAAARYRLPSAPLRPTVRSKCGPVRTVRSPGSLF